MFLLDPKILRPEKRPEGGYRHLVILLDVSPSMQLSDAGPGGQQTRAKRAAEILMSILNRIALEQCRVSVVAFYNGAKPVVIDTSDPEVVRNILSDLPLDQAFNVGTPDSGPRALQPMSHSAGWRAPDNACRSPA